MRLLPLPSLRRPLFRCTFFSAHGPSRCKLKLFFIGCFAAISDRSARGQPFITDLGLEAVDSICRRLSGADRLVIPVAPSLSSMIVLKKKGFFDVRRIRVKTAAEGSRSACRSDQMGRCVSLSFIIVHLTLKNFISPDK